MNNLSEQMQARLDKWRNKALPVVSTAKVRGNTQVRRTGGKSDYGDAMSLEDLEEEALKSQTRR